MLFSRIEMLIKMFKCDDVKNWHWFASGRIFTTSESASPATLVGSTYEKIIYPHIFGNTSAKKDMQQLTNSAIKARKKIVIFCTSHFRDVTACPVKQRR